MKVSVVIPTYNGKHKIVNLLRSLEQQTLQDFETVVLIDGSTDETETFLKNQVFQLNLKIFSQKNEGRAVARNVGASLSSGEVLVFFDDDIRVKEDTMQKHYEHHLKNPNSALVGMANLDPEFCNTEISKYRYFIETQRWQSNNSNRVIQMNKNNLQITTQNFSIIKKIFEELKGFDERLRDSEDFELGIRLLENNIPVFLDESLEVWHDDYVSFEAYLKRQEEYAIARYGLSNLRPNIIKDYPRDFALTQNMLAKHWKNRLKSIFAYNSFWKSLLNNLFFKKLIPKKISYIIYDWLIYANSRASLLEYLQKKASKNEAFSKTKTSLQ